MKKVLSVVIIALVALVISNKVSFAEQAGKKEIGKDALKTEEEVASYGMGLGMGKTFLKKINFELNMDLFIKGLEDGLSEDGKQLMTDEEIRTQMQAFQQKMMKKQGEESKKKGAKFLKENKKKKGVVTLASGLQYKVIKEGTGPIPKSTDTVKVHYKGTTIDGKEFDSSFKRKKPAKFSVNRVVKGWTEALLLMKVGSKWQLFIPSELGYGERGAGRNIGPNETLIFDVELISIEEPKKPKSDKPAGKKGDPKKKSEAKKK